MRSMPVSLARQIAWLSCLFLAVVLVAGCDGSGSAAPVSAGKSEGKGDRQSDGKTDGKGEPKARSVKLVAAQESTTDRRVSATGTLAADESVVLGTKVAGRIAEIPADLGTRVRQGQIVARQ